MPNTPVTENLLQSLIPSIHDMAIFLRGDPMLTWDEVQAELARDDDEAAS